MTMIYNTKQIMFACKGVGAFNVYGCIMEDRARFGSEDAAFMYSSDPAMLHSGSGSGSGSSSDSASAESGGAYRGLRYFQSPDRHVSCLLTATDLSQSLQTAIQLLFFNEDFPENMTVYLSSTDASTGHVWNGKTWQSVPVMELATMVMRRAVDVLYNMRIHYLYNNDDVLYFRNNLYMDIHDSPPSLVRRYETIETLAIYSQIVSNPPVQSVGRTGTR